MLWSAILTKIGNKQDVLQLNGLCLQVVICYILHCQLYECNANLSNGQDGGSTTSHFIVGKQKFCFLSFKKKRAIPYEQQTLSKPEMQQL